MFRIISPNNSLPDSFPVDPSAEFQGGMIGQLNVFGNNIVLGVSDGTAPYGILDDVKTNAFTAPSVDEPIIVDATGVLGPGNKLVTPIDIKTELQYSNIMASSFISNPVDAELIPKNGVLIFPAGTELNFDRDGDGTPDAIRTVVSYIYQIPNMIGDDSTAPSGRVTVWYTRIRCQTTCYDTSVPYAINATLFCNEKGMFTTRRANSDIPGIAICTAPPTSLFGALELLWL